MLPGRILAIALAVGTPLATLAVDAPHEAGSNCSNCHMGHNAPGGSLTSVLGNFNLCSSCHDTVPSSTVGFPWAVGDQAVPGVSGHSHRWDANASNLGATPPAPGTPMGDRLEGGNLQCSTCHDQHQADAFATGERGTQHVSLPVGSPQAPAVGGAGGGTLTVNAPNAAATAKGYLIDVVAQGSGTTATFRLSNDNGTSWFGCTAPTTYTYVAYTGANACRVGANVPLNDGANVTVTFAGGANSIRVGDQWKLYVSYPFLRVANGDAAMCVTCHQDRHMYWQDVEGGVANGVAGGRLGSVTLGTTVFHHPVGQALAKAYDQPAVLDASGVTQATGDGNATNDLALGTGGIVTCVTCHHPHNADSNSLTTDPR